MDLSSGPHGDSVSTFPTKPPPLLCKYCAIWTFVDLGSECTGRCLYNQWGLTVYWLFLSSSSDVISPGGVDLPSQFPYLGWSNGLSRVLWGIFSEIPLGLLGRVTLSVAKIEKIWEHVAWKKSGRHRKTISVGRTTFTFWFWRKCVKEGCASVTAEQSWIAGVGLFARLFFILLCILELFQI